MNDKMFRVLVLGGMALVGCGGSIAAKSTSGEGGEDKGAADAEPQDASSPNQGFPAEGNAAVGDASVSSKDAATGGGSSGGPVPPDATPGEPGTTDAGGFADVRRGLPPCGVYPCEGPVP